MEKYKRKRESTTSTIWRNGAPPYQRMRILLILHACQLKQRTDLWCKNTSFFSRKKKHEHDHLYVLYKRELFVLWEWCNGCYGDQGQLNMHWCISWHVSSERRIYLEQRGHVLKKDGPGPLFVLFSYCVLIIWPFLWLFPRCQRTPCELQER